MPRLTVEILSDDRLSKAVDTEIFQQGKILHQLGRAKVVELADPRALCQVHDRHPYKVEIKVANNYLYLKCECRYAIRGLICEHEIAACLAIRDRLQQNLPPTWRAQVSRILDATQSSPKSPAVNRYWLFFSLQEATFTNTSFWRINAHILPVNVLRRAGFDGDIHNLSEVQSFIAAQPHVGSQLRTPYHSLNPEGCLNNSLETVMLSNLLLERTRTLSSFSSTFPIDDYLSLIARSGSPIYLNSAGSPLGTPLFVSKDPAEITLNFSQDSRGVLIKGSLDLEGQTIHLGNINSQKAQPVISISPIWYLVDNQLFQLDNPEHSDLFRSLLSVAEIIIPPKDETAFLERYFVQLATRFTISGDFLRWETIDTTPSLRLYLSESNAGIQAELRFGYAEIEIPYDPSYPVETIHLTDEPWLFARVRRLPEVESQAYDQLTTPSYGLKKSPLAPRPGVLSLRARIHPVDFLLHKIPHLIADGYEVYGEEQLKTARVNRNTPTISFSVSSGIDWFDVHTVVNFGDLAVSLKEIRQSLRKHERYVKLSDGTIGELPAEWTDRYRQLFNFGEEKGDSLRFSRHHLSLIDEALSPAEQQSTDSQYQLYRQRLLNFDGINQKELPRLFVGDLRPYQRAGYDWLHFLHEYEFSGCLADDMGLGKTIQVLAFLQSIKEGIGVQNHDNAGDGSQHHKILPHTSLIVVPRSLLVNWQREAERFTPQLRILEYFEGDRIRDTSLFDQYDLVITTYGVMLRDISFLRKYQFHIIILDESQAIKNPASQTARAARLLHSRHRLALSGTPVENSTLELWSQFAYLIPGLLGNLEFFKNEFSIPIEKKADKQAVVNLRRLVYPFILRRTKDQVAPELPPRTERILYCDMEPAQRKLYNKMRDYYRGYVLGMIDTEGLNNSRLKILEGLLRLRQISNHPRLVDEKFQGEFGKFELLLDTLQTLHSENHKALVFSQFVQMLRLVREGMDHQALPYLYLDGKTRNRMEIVDQFQIDESIPFFLISLKAGGQGLNLTAADYVIHIDPWWNPAVEMQASDRTHRIGQFKPVIIFKLITRDTVEEKILLLQEQKRNIVDQIITTESSFFKALTEEDIQMLFT